MFGKDQVFAIWRKVKDASIQIACAYQQAAVGS
jgi:hypothetical protein